MEEYQQGKKGSILFWSIPLIITVIFGLFVLNFLGFPIGKTIQDWGKKIPVINQIIPDPAISEGKKNNEIDSKYWKDQFSKKQDLLIKKNQEIDTLKSQVQSMKNELSVNKGKEELQKKEEAKQGQKNHVTALFENLPPAKAAAMVETMSIEQASLMLSQLEPEIQSNILGKMKDAKKAAQITIMLLK